MGYGSSILITERGNTGTVIIPWTPEKINFKSGKMQWASYDIMDLGNIKEATGIGLRSVGWSNGILPAESMKNMPWQHHDVDGDAKWHEPKHYQGLFSMWLNNRAPLTIYISDTPICMNVKVASYNVTYKDGFGNYYYDIEFQEDKELTFSVTSIEPDVTEIIERDVDQNMTTYTIKDGDTLWGIAECYLRNSARYTEIYELNKDVIEEAARKYNHPNSQNGDLIFPGTVLKLPSEASSGETGAGVAIELSNAPIYRTSTDPNSVARFSGTYYLYDGKNMSGRYRICKNPADVGRQPVGEHVDGWLPAEYI